MGAIVIKSSLRRSGTVVGQVMACLGCALFLLVGMVGAAEARTLRVAPDTQYATPGVPFELIFRVEPARNIADERGRLPSVEISVLKSPVQNFIMEPAKFPLSRAGTASGRLRIWGATGADL